jgi:hypothetical protein
LLALIVKCGVCGLIMARNVFEFHKCGDRGEIADDEGEED